MMKLFPTDVSIGSVATARLMSVRPSHLEVVGRFELAPNDMSEFLDRIGGLRNFLGRRYEPLPGTWTSFVVPADRDDIELLVGIMRPYGQAMARAHRDLRSPASSIVSDLSVRTLALGYLARAGV